MILFLTAYAEDKNSNAAIFRHVFKLVTVCYQNDQWELLQAYKLLLQHLPEMETIPEELSKIHQFNMKYFLQTKGCVREYNKALGALHLILDGEIGKEAKTRKNGLHFINLLNSITENIEAN